MWWASRKYYDTRPVATKLIPVQGLDSRRESTMSGVRRAVKYLPSSLKPIKRKQRERCAATTLGQHKRGLGWWRGPEPSINVFQEGRSSDCSHVLQHLTTPLYHKGRPRGTSVRIKKLMICGGYWPLDSAGNDHTRALALSNLSVTINSCVATSDARTEVRLKQEMLLRVHVCRSLREVNILDQFTRRVVCFSERNVERI